MVQIRRYEDRDHTDVVQLHHLGLDQFGANAGPGPWDDDLGDITGHYLNVRGEFLVGTNGSRVVAMGALRRVSDDTGEIKRLRVHPDFQRRGFGEQILATLEATAADLGYSRLVLDTTTNQAPAQAFFLKHGYAKSGSDVSGTLTVIFFEKALGPARNTKKAPPQGPLLATRRSLIRKGSDPHLQ